MIAVFVLSGCGSIGEKKNSANGTVHLTFGHGQAEGHPYHKAALYFKEQVENKTNGRVIVDIQPNGNLGDEREMTEGLQLGTIDITVAVAATLSGFDSDMDVFNFPYLFDTREQAFQVLDSETGKEIFDGMKEQGIEIYGTFDLGFRSMTNSKHPIKTPEDIYNSRFYEVQKYLSLTEHFYPVCPLMVSDLMWDKLSDEDAAIVKEELYDMVDYEREVAGDELDKTLQAIKDSGMEVNEVDKEAFKEAVAPVYDKYADKYGDLFKKIEAAKEEK